MNFTKLKQDVLKANLLLKKYNLVIHTWGNVSQISDCGKYFAIKPSGVSYDKLKYDDIVVLDLKGNIIEGKLKPSSDTPTHLEIYNSWPGIKGIVHTHSPYAVAWASTGKSIPCFSTTHADNFYGDILCTRELSELEIKNNYELNTGKIIISEYQKHNLDPKVNKAVLVKSHGPFSWSYKNGEDAVNLTLTLEEISKIATHTLAINAQQKEMVQFLQDKHYNRKHGKNKYYGQNKN